MALYSKENHNNIKDEIQKERRSFLKKTVYAAPSIMALGQLVRPTVAGASTLDNQNAGNNNFGGGDNDNVFGEW